MQPAIHPHLARLAVYNQPMTSAFRTSLAFLAFGFVALAGTGCSSSSDDGGGNALGDDAGVQADTGEQQDAGYVDAGDPNPALRNPALANETAPDVFRAKFVTTKGDFVIEVTRSWAPNGADRFYNLVKIGFYNNAYFFRVLTGFVAQWGLNGVPGIDSAWQSKTIQDDPVVQSNTAGFVTFAKTSQPNSRTTQVFINYGNNARLDADGFAPFGKVVEGMDVAENLYDGYNDSNGPNQGEIASKGNSYLKNNFPELDSIKEAIIEE
jgi:peptidyl-prolyl cis-trans isomerase A (cyclophilin A)